MAIPPAQQKLKSGAYFENKELLPRFIAAYNERGLSVIGLPVERFMAAPSDWRRAVEQRNSHIAPDENVLYYHDRLVSDLDLTDRPSGQEGRLMSGPLSEMDFRENFIDDDLGGVSWIANGSQGAQKFKYIVYRADTEDGFLPPVPSGATLLGDVPTYMTGFGPADTDGMPTTDSGYAASPVQIMRAVIEATRISINEKLSSNSGPVRFYFGALRPELDRIYGSKTFTRRLIQMFPPSRLERADGLPAYGERIVSYVLRRHPPVV